MAPASVRESSRIGWIASWGGAGRGGGAVGSEHYLLYIVHQIEILRTMDEFNSLGEFEHLLMLAVVRLEQQAYGVTIRTILEERAGRGVSLGAVYSTLRRLERKGYVATRRGDPTPVRGGRARKYFTLTKAGLEALTRSNERLARMADGLELFRPKSA